jgi:SAM-dependent methyltransferase
MGRAFNIRLPDASVHGYAQKYCFLNGPDPELNRALRELVPRVVVELSEEKDADRIEFLGVEEQARIERELMDSLHLPPELGLNESTRRDWIRDLGWKVRAIPATARDVLVLGSASCREAVLIRRRLPQARIVCADFADARIPNIEEALDVRFLQGDFHELLAARPVSFDAIFSNHVLEHLFDPDRTLRLVQRALRPGGRMVAALPLDGQLSAPFNLPLHRHRLHPFDMCEVDVAHGWKTNVTDLAQHLRAAGFSEQTFLGRDRYFSVARRAFPNRAAFERRARKGIFLNRLVFGSTRGALKRVFPGEVPPLVLKAVFGIEHRTWFGFNRLKNEFSVECLVTAWDGDSQ